MQSPVVIVRGVRGSNETAQPLVFPLKETDGVLSHMRARAEKVLTHQGGKTTKAQVRWAAKNPLSENEK